MARSLLSSMLPREDDQQVLGKTTSSKLHRHVLDCEEDDRYPLPDEPENEPRREKVRAKKGAKRPRSSGTQPVTLERKDFEPTLQSSMARPSDHDLRKAAIPPTLSIGWRPGPRRRSHSAHWMVLSKPSKFVAGSHAPRWREECQAGAVVERRSAPKKDSANRPKKIFRVTSTKLRQAIRRRSIIRASECRPGDAQQRAAC